MELLEKLEELFSVLVSELQKLKCENRRLEDQVQSLSDELSGLRSREAELDSKLVLLESLKSENIKINSQKEQVRNRIRTILKNLEKIDFI
tara:strand:+ start:289 stop:561 length:273 start_codon:yes stop_codon:yes gene_type:complete